MKTPTPLLTIDDIKDRNRAAGQHWFDPGAMRFFNTRSLSHVSPTRYGGAYFVTSEQRPHSTDARRYTVRYCDAEGHIHTAGPFQGHPSSASAKLKATVLAAGEV